MIRKTARQLCFQYNSISVSIAQLIRTQPSYSEQDFAVIREAFTMPTMSLMLDALYIHFDYKVQAKFAAICFCKKFGFYKVGGELKRKFANRRAITFPDFCSEVDERLEIAHLALQSRMLSYINAPSPQY